MSSDKKQLAQFTQIGEIAAQTARDNLLVAFRSQGISEQVLAVAADDLLFATKQKYNTTPSPNSSTTPNTWRIILLGITR
jgi:hypothetical protein